MADERIPGTIQSIFLERIRALVPDHISFADRLAELLNVSRDSAYRRIRGETVLSLDEVKKLCDRFGESLDALLSPASNASLFHHRSPGANYPFEQWLTSIGRNLEVINGFTEHELIYAARDMPIFQYLRLPELSAFKMFFWMKTFVKDPRYSEALFKPELISDDLLASAKHVWKLYASVPVSEIWSDEAINETLKQIEFYHECGFFASKEEGGRLCDRLIDLLNLVRTEAADGKTTEGKTYHLYENEILIADNTVFARMGKRRIVYITYNALNLLTTHQASFCEKTEYYMRSLTKNSTLISATAERERNKFFNKMNDRIGAFKARLG